MKVKERFKADHEKTMERTALKLNSSALNGSLTTENNSLSALQIGRDLVCSVLVL